MAETADNGVSQVCLFQQSLDKNSADGKQFTSLSPRPWSTFLLQPCSH